MEATMGSKGDWQERYFDEKFSNIDEKFVAFSTELKANTKITKDVQKGYKDTLDRVILIEDEVFGSPKKKDLMPFYRDPKVIQILLFLSLTLLIIASAITGFDLKGLL